MWVAIKEYLVNLFFFSRVWLSEMKKYDLESGAEEYPT